ncbi:hypothetical protein TNCV_571321 [Trichonephila clavipes]|nr:hypothetical protein TNCV_571321 [Trichonephila clavipes]
MKVTMENSGFCRTVAVPSTSTQLDSSRGDKTSISILHNLKLISKHHDVHFQWIPAMLTSLEMSKRTAAREGCSLLTISSCHYLLRAPVKINRQLSKGGDSSLPPLKLVEVEIGGVPSIVPSRGSRRRAKSYCHLYVAQGQRPAPHFWPFATMNFVGLDLTTSDG